MNHQEAVKLLPWYVNGTLQAEERHIVQEHLKRCFQCKAELKDWERLGAVLNETSQEAPEPPSRLPRQVVEQILPEVKKAGPKPVQARAPKPWRRSQRLFQAAAAILLGALAIQNLYLNHELSQLAQPHALAPVQVSSEIRGSVPVELPQQASWIYLQIEIPPIPLDRSYSELGYQLRSEGDEVLFSGKARLAGKLDLFLPASNLYAGRYTLVVTGTEQSHSDELSSYTIDLQRK